MTTFYYWVPGRRDISINDLKSLGLGYAFEDSRTPRGCENGPDGKHGIVVCHGPNRDGRLGYWANRQIWKRIPNSDVWCGCYSDSKPTPDDLARSEQVSGVWLTLDDGNRWLAPMARRWIEMDDRLLWDYNLPCRLSLDDAGNWVPGEVKPKYERLWNLALAYETAAQQACADSEASTVRFAFDEVDELAISALQVNYRIGPTELDILGIYDVSSRQAIISALLDTATWETWIKKKVAAVGLGGENS